MDLTLISLFCVIDDFCQELLPQWNAILLEDFKLHIIVNDMGELMAFKMSKATTDDRVVLPKMAENLTGKIIGDKGYISQNYLINCMKKDFNLSQRFVKT